MVGRGAFLLVTAILLIAFGCMPRNQVALVVEDNTPMVGEGHATTEGLGIETLGGVFTPLIKSGTAVPCSVSEVFTTAQDSQSQIAITLFRGKNKMVADNHELGQFQITGIPPEPRGEPQIEVTLSVTQAQILLSARDLSGNSGLRIQRVRRIKLQ